MNNNLPRPFIYRDRKDIDEFLDESPLWRDIYNTFLQVKDNSYYLKVSALTMFNEVRYQCVRLRYDKHPEEDVWGNYLSVARDNLGTQYASNLCFAMVYTVLQLQKNRPRNVEYFCSFLKSKYLDKDQYYYPGFKSLIDSCKDRYETDFKSCPCYPEDFDVEVMGKNGFGFVAKINKYDSEWWKKETLDFDQDIIRKIVFLWHTKEERIEVLNRIERAFDQIEYLPF